MVDIAPPEVGEYRFAGDAALSGAREADLAQVEYTYLASYGGDVLVEHDVTFDLYAQIHARRKTLGAWWDWWRWHRFETRAIRQFQRVVVMSEKDRALLGVEFGSTRVIENGVDLGAISAPAGDRRDGACCSSALFGIFRILSRFVILTNEILPLTPGCRTYGSCRSGSVAALDASHRHAASRLRRFSHSRIRGRRSAALSRSERRRGADARIGGDQC